MGLFDKLRGKKTIPEPKPVGNQKLEAPVVIVPPENPRLVTQDTPGGVPAGVQTLGNKPTNMAELLKGSVFDPMDAVAVQPQGVVGLTKDPRIWPKPHPEMGENAWGYATRCTQTTNPATGKPFFDINILGLYPLGATPKMRPYVYENKFAHVADMYMYGSDWMTAEEVKADQKSKEAWEKHYSPEAMAERNKK